MLRQIFLDTETTGLNPEQGDRIVEIACVEMVNRQLTGKHLHHYFNPQRPCHEAAVRVHGLTDDFLSDKPLFAERAMDIIEFCRGAEIIIHNAPFDIGFLESEFGRLDKVLFTDSVATVTDTLLMAREVFPGKSNSLDALCKRLEVDNSHRHLHGALMDAQLLASVYINLTRGQDTLLMDDSSTTGDAHDHLLPDQRTNYAQMHFLELMPTAHELQAFESLLTDIDKACGGKTIWKT